MDFGLSYFIMLLTAIFSITFILVALHSNFLSTKKFSIKQFFIKQYYLFKRLLHSPIEIYSWLYSVFFDSNKDFENKYSKYNSIHYKKRKQQDTHSFYSNFNHKSKHTNFNSTKPEDKDIHHIIISNNSFTNNPAYNQFFLDSSYEILGIPYNSNFEKVTRPAYIKLINKYHQDKLTINDKKHHQELFNEISKRINAAYDKLKREHISDRFR